MKVADLMTRSTTAVEQYAGIHEIAKLLLEQRTSSFPVVNERGRIVGIVSEADLLRPLGTRSNGARRKMISHRSLNIWITSLRTRLDWGRVYIHSGLPACGFHFAPSDCWRGPALGDPETLLVRTSQIVSFVLASITIGALVLWSNKASLLSKMIAIETFLASLQRSTCRRRNVYSLENNDESEADAAPGTPPAGSILLITLVRRQSDTRRLSLRLSSALDGAIRRVNPRGLARPNSCTNRVSAQLASKLPWMLARSR